MYIYAILAEMRFEFDEEKSALLKKNRGVSFEEVIELIKLKGILANIKHPNQQKYPHQRVFIIDINHYAYVVPFISKTVDTVFLKTLYPSRVFTKKYITNYEKQKN